MKSKVDVMHPLALNPGDYPGTYKLIGGTLSLDFVNTVSWPGTAREHDWLDRPENVTVWAVAAGLIDEPLRHRLDAQPPEQAEKQLHDVHRIRSDLQHVLEPLAHDTTLPTAAVETLNGLLHQISRRRRIDPERLQWTWAVPTTLPEILAPVIEDAARILTDVDHRRIGHCPSCHWLFYDHTRNRSRRWCDMADCGSRDKALRYYHRTKSSAEPRRDAE